MVIDPKQCYRRKVDYPRHLMKGLDGVGVLEEFLKESNYEDFYEEEKGTIFVSTIHKSKGREFDTVYMMLNGNSLGTEAEKRKLYVGMTRAKEALYLYYLKS